jgi:hypothetical protein
LLFAIAKHPMRGSRKVWQRKLSMKKTALLAVVASLLGPVTAWADQGSMDFLIDQIDMSGSGGRWITDNTFWTEEFVYRGVPDESSYRYVRHASTDLDPTASAGEPFGHYDDVLPPINGFQLSASNHVRENHLYSSWQRGSLTDFANTFIDWRRSFTLDPFASVTLSGLATLVSPVPSSPQSTFGWVPNQGYEYANRGTLTWQDPALIFTGVVVEGSIFTGDPRDLGSLPTQNRIGQENDFTYSADSFGHLSLTIHNRSAETLFGQFEVFAYASTLPIPEPATFLMMGIGLGLIALRQRRENWRHRT